MDNLALLIQAPSLAVQLLIDGVLIGAVFALAAYGLALVWGVMNIINVCQGEFVMLGGYVALYVARAGLNPFLGIPAAMIVLFVVGWLRLPPRDLPHRRARPLHLAARHLRPQHPAGPDDEPRLRRQHRDARRPSRHLVPARLAW